MSVLIKGLDMPKSCNDCLFTQNSICQLVGRSWNWGMMERRSDCPLVEVPTPHGRLIDEDCFNLNKIYCIGDEEEAFTDLQKAITDAPTVIEAEE